MSEQKHDKGKASFDSKRVSAIHQELHSHLPSESALRVKALETVLVKKGLLKSETIDAFIEQYRDEVGPMRGARVVAKAWVDDAFKKRLLTDASAAVAELGYQGHATGHLQAVENTPDTHNVVVCTLCSCYPFALLGMAPAWYKQAAYRSRVVREPRVVLEEFGVQLPQSTRIKVWDSTAELRYLVVPMRPEGTAGLSEDELAQLVGRDSMIGTALANQAG